MMNYGDLFKKFNLDHLHLNAGFLSAQFSPLHSDEEAAWEMYVYMITTVLTQELKPEDGVEKAALTSVYNIFGKTRDILVRRGRKAQRFSKIAVVVLNQIVRPFTAKWHKKSVNGAFENSDECKKFRNELEHLQVRLRNYAALLAYIADVEDITYVQLD